MICQCSKAEESSQLAILHQIETLCLANIERLYKENTANTEALTSVSTASLFPLIEVTQQNKDAMPAAAASGFSTDNSTVAKMLTAASDHHVDPAAKPSPH